jgi:hypothetical protein
MSFDIFLSADEEDSKDARVSVAEIIGIDEGINHYGWVLSLIEVARLGNRAVIFPKMCIAKQRGLVE